MDTANNSYSKSGVWTVPITGVYHIDVRAIVSMGNAVTYSISMELHVGTACNGAITEYAQQSGTSGSGQGVVTVALSTVLALSKGNQVQFCSYLAADADKSIYLGVVGGNKLSIYQV